MRIKEKQKRKKTKNVEEVTKQVQKIKLKDDTKVKTTKSKAEKAQKQKEQAIVNNQETDPVKRLRNLKKRLREIEQLEEKLNNQLIPKPEPEQLAKVQRKNDLLMQINELEKKV